MSRRALALEYPLTPGLEREWVAAASSTPINDPNPGGPLALFLVSILAPHGLEVLHDVRLELHESPKGRTLRVEPVVERTVDDVGDGALVALPDRARLEELGWEVGGTAWNAAPAEQDEPGLAVAGDDLPRTAAALVTAWWDERRDDGTIRRRPSVDPPDSPSSGSGVLHPDLVTVGEASLYAARLEQEARTVRAAVAHAVSDTEVRDAEYATALRALAERMDGQAAGATLVAADLIMEGQARVASAREAGLDGEGWALTADPAPGE